MSRRQDGCRSSASNSPELRNGFFYCLYSAFVTWKLALGYTVWRKGSGCAGGRYTTIRGYPHAGGGHGPKSKNLGNQKTDIIRQRARGSAAPSCPPHLPVPRVLASSRRCFSLTAFHPPAPGFRFQPFSFLPHTQMSESSSATARSLLPGFLISHSIHSQSSNVRWVCCWRDVVPIRRRTKRGQTVGWRFSHCDRAGLWSDTFKNDG